MIKIRKNVFETNSSSTHSICISKGSRIADGSKVTFVAGEFGWEDAVVDPADYLYTAIINSGNREENLERLTDILYKHNITCRFVENGSSYIDHREELHPFLEDVLSDEDRLLRFLSKDSVVYTGNDNSNECDDMCYSAKGTIYTDDWETVPNPNHDENKYEYYFKGN